MKFFIEDILKKRTDDLTFIQIKKDAQLRIENYKIPEEGLYVPLLTEELAQNIKTRKEDEVLTIGSIIRGMIYTLGIDSKFRFNEEYIKFLNAVNPKIKEYITYEGARLFNDHKLLESVIFFKVLILLDNQNTQGLFNYALSLMKYAEEQLKNKNNAYKLFRKEAKDKLEILINIDKDFSQAYYHLGFLYRETNQYNKAKICWEMALKMDLEESFKEQIRALLLGIKDLVKYEDGYGAVLSGKLKEGLFLLKELEKKYEDWWNLLFFIGLGYRQLGEYKEAIPYFEKVLRIKPDQLDAVVELGLCYAGEGEFEASAKQFYRAILQGGENSEIRCNLAMVYMELNRLQEAEECLKKSMEMKPEDEITQKCWEKLQMMKKNNR